MSTYTKRSSTRRSDDTMDDDPEDKDDTKRKSRNLSEKKRRDQFNMLVNELSSMVSTGARKMDKSTVLKSTISFLKNHNEITIRSRAHEIQEDWKPAFLSNEEFTHLILEALDGFIVVFAASGHIHYVSESITALLGHPPSDLLNTTIYDLVWEEEQAALYQALVGGAGPEGQLSFQVHLRRGGGNNFITTTGTSSPTSMHQDTVTRNTHCYELVNFVGYLRTDVDMLEMDNTRFSGYSGEADTRLFVGTGRLQTPQLIREMSIVDSAKSEFISRHSLEWKFLFLDHRAPPIIGYLPFEVLGTSGYDYYHVDDLDKVVSCHEALMQKGEGTSCYYRFLTKGQQWIWLQTRFYITYHQWNSKPEFIVCTHRVVSYVDVMKQTRKDCNGSRADNAIVSNTGVSDNVGGMGDVSGIDTSPVPTSTPGSGTSSPWGAASSSHRGSNKSSPVRHRTPSTPSDCTTMSADSRQSNQQQHLITHNGVAGTRSVNRLNSQNANLPPPPPPSQQAVPVSAGHVPSTQYVTAIPVQPVLARFPEPALPAVDNLVLTAATAVSSPSGTGAAGGGGHHLQAQLQRKHAELQAIIGQQQAELRRVSEQLLMARLGLLPSAIPGQPVQIQQPSSQHHHPQQQQQHTLLNVSVQTW
ncbi:Clock [Carabus blaptoides fortunei]